MEENALVQVFNNSEFGSVRTVTIENEPWFVGKDVAVALGYKEPAKATREKVDPEDRGVSEIDTPGGIQDVVIINESGLYSLVLSSKLESAKRFKRWVTSEVIPSIRKHGAYMTQDVLKECLCNPRAVAELLTKLADTEEANKRLSESNNLLTATVEEQKPKVTYCDNILNSPALTPITTIAKDYGMSGKKMNQLLSDFGIQYKRGSSWYLYQQYADKGYTQSKTYGEGIVFTNTEWTQTGRMFLYEELKKHHILPVIERNNLTEVI